MLINKYRKLPDMFYSVQDRNFYFLGCIVGKDVNFLLGTKTSRGIPICSVIKSYPAQIVIWPFRVHVGKIVGDKINEKRTLNFHMD